MRNIKVFGLIIVCFCFLTLAHGGSIYDRTGQNHWFSWYGDKDHRIGYNNEKYEKIIYKNKVTLKTTSILQHRAGEVVNDFSITLYSSELEPMIELSVKAVEKQKDGELFTTTVKGKPDGVNYIFHVNRNGENKEVKVPRMAFDYFDFEDHFLYSRTVPGKSRTYKVLNSFTLGVENKTIEYQGDEKIDVEGKSYLCRKYNVKNKNSESKIWREKSTHAIVKQTFGKGAYILRTDMEKAKDY